jgi:hypothetical protein
MLSPRIYRREPRGRFSLGFQMEAPGEVALRDSDVLHCTETRSNGKAVGELEVALFAAALIIDRDGILSEKACASIAQLASFPRGATAVAVKLPGAGGFRADAIQGTALPYLHVFALAPYDLGVSGGVVITIRSATPEWPAADHMLRSLRILTRNGRLATSAEADDGPLLPVVMPED